MTSFSTCDLADLARAQAVVLAPLAYVSPAAWMEAVVQTLGDLFEASRGVGTVCVSGTSVHVADGVADAALGEYDAEVAAVDLAGELVVTRRTPYYVEADFAGDARFDAHVRSAAYNEWYRPHGLTDAVGLFVSDDSDWASPGVPVVANVLLTGSPLSAGPRADRARAMLGLLQPALAASVGAWRQAADTAARTGAAVGQVVDGLAAVAWIFDEAGRLVHESAEATRSPYRDVLRAEASRLAARLMRASRDGCPAQVSQAVPAGPHPVRLLATLLQADGPTAPAALVSADGSRAPRVDAAAVQARFQLTPQQARVALGLADRRSTDEIAEALCISPHTVRRHVEQVLSALGVARRHEIEGVVYGPAA